MTHTGIDMGESFARGDLGYEDARVSTVWNGRVPDRYPDLIVRPATDGEVAEAIRFAAREGMKVGVRSGGHSWAASFLRDEGMLLDLRHLNEISVDPEERCARVGPAARGGDLNAALEPLGLMFTAGHLASVGLGGYLLQGGFGWNSRKLGLACENLVAIDAVTADGELVHTDAENHPDLYWAARGAGPGFFAVAIRFHLRLHPRPTGMTSAYFFPVTAIDELLQWADTEQPNLPRHLETAMITTRDQAGDLVLILSGDALGETAEESREALRALERVANSVGPKGRSEFVPTTLAELMKRGDGAYPEGVRYVADNTWTDAPSHDLLPQVHAILASLPPAPSHFFIQLWGPPREIPDMAFSMQARIWMTCYAATRDPAQDDAHARLVTEAMRSLEPLAAGIQLGDENLGRRPFRFMAPEHLARLQEIRAVYDPCRLFHSYLGVPTD